MSNAVPQKKTFFQIANKNFIIKVNAFTSDFLHHCIRINIKLNPDSI